MFLWNSLLSEWCCGSRNALATQSASQVRWLLDDHLYYKTVRSLGAVCLYVFFSFVNTMSLSYDIFCGVVHADLWHDLVITFTATKVHRSLPFNCDSPRYVPSVFHTSCTYHRTAKLGTFFVGFTNKQLLE